MLRYSILVNARFLWIVKSSLLKKTLAKLKKTMVRNKKNCFLHSLFKTSTAGNNLAKKTLYPLRKNFIPFNIAAILKGLDMRICRKKPSETNMSAT